MPGLNCSNVLGGLKNLTHNINSLSSYLRKRRKDPTHAASQPGGPWSWSWSHHGMEQGATRESLADKPIALLLDNLGEGTEAERLGNCAAVTNADELCTCICEHKDNPLASGAILGNLGTWKSCCANCEATRNAMFESTDVCAKDVKLHLVMYFEVYRPGEWQADNAPGPYKTTKVYAMEGGVSPTGNPFGGVVDTTITNIEFAQGETVATPIPGQQSPVGDGNSGTVELSQQRLNDIWTVYNAWTTNYQRPTPPNVDYWGFSLESTKTDPTTLHQLGAWRESSLH